MSAVTVSEMRAIENRAMERGVSEGELMEMAGVALGRMLGVSYPNISRAVGYLGKGHNAGDALIALRVLRDEFGWKVGFRSAYPKDACAELTQTHWFCGADEPLVVGQPVLLVDGLLGIGGKGDVRQPLLELSEEMRSLREMRGAIVVAVDVPSGMNADDGSAGAGAVVADRTFMIGATKRGLLLGEAANHTGGLALVKVEDLESENRGDSEMICPQTMNFGKRPREFDFHKGMAGRVGILAGSPAFTGAALIATLGALRAGGGLVTLHTPGSEDVISRMPLEAMLKPCSDARDLLDGNYDALVVGPGLGDFSTGLKELITEAKIPMVIDADGLNFMARHGIAATGEHLLTPHPGEFRKLAPELADQKREEAAKGFVSGKEMVLLLKGGRTLVAADGEGLRVNSTGTPAMANGGQGDLLAGVLGALLAGGMSRFDAAAMGSWLCGRAAEISIRKNGDPCIATDVAQQLGAALSDWKTVAR